MTALALCRFAHFLAAMLTFGMSAYLWLYASERLRLALSPAVRRLAIVASLVALITAIAWLALESALMADDWSAAIDPDQIGAVLTDTAFGRVWAMHLALAAALVAVVAFGPRTRWAATSLVSAMLLASLGLVGHAAMQTGAEGVLHRSEPRRPSLDDRRVDWRARSLRDVPSALSSGMISARTPCRR